MKHSEKRPAAVLSILRTGLSGAIMGSALLLLLLAGTAFSQVIPDIDELRAQAGIGENENQVRGPSRRQAPAGGADYPYNRGAARRPGMTRSNAAPSAPAGEGLQELLDDQEKLLKKYGFSYLDPDKDKVRLSFKEIQLKEALQFISLQTGINLFLDTDIRSEKPVTLFIENLSLREILDNLILSNGLMKKVVSKDTYLVFPNRKEKEYAETVPEIFSLRYEDAKELLKVLKTKDNYVFLSDRTNSIIVYDSPENMKQIRRIVEAVDKARPQLEIQLELLEVERKKLREYGIKLTDLEDPGVGLQSLVDTAKHNTINLGSPQLTMLKELSSTKILASPKIRLVDYPSNGKPGQATIQIGGKEPIRIYTTSGSGATGQTSSLEAQYTTSIQWQDTGVKMIVTAEKIHSSEEATVKIEMEVTSITSYTTEGYPRVRTKTATSTLRLYDGETVVMGGLINNELKKVLSKVPLLGDMPVVGKLFRRDDFKHEETEIVMLVTPRILMDENQPVEDDRAIERYTNVVSDVAGGAEGIIRTYSQRAQFSDPGDVKVSAPAAESKPPVLQPSSASDRGSADSQERRARVMKILQDLKSKYDTEAR